MLGLALAVAIIGVNAQGQLVLASNGNSIAAIQWQGHGQASSVPTKTLACGASLCMLYGVNQTVIPDGVIATGVSMVGAPVAVAPSGVAVPVQMILPPANLTEVIK